LLLLVDDLDDFAGIGLLVELQDEIFRFDRIAFVVEFDRAGDSFEAFQLAHGGGYVRARRFLSWVRLQPSLHRFDADHSGVVAVHAEGFVVFTEALLKLFRELGVQIVPDVQSFDAQDERKNRPCMVRLSNHALFKSFQASKMSGELSLV